MRFTPPVVEITEEKAFKATETPQAMIDRCHEHADGLRIGLFAICMYVKGNS